MQQKQWLSGSWSCACGQRGTLRKLKEQKQPNTQPSLNFAIINTIKSGQQFPIQDIAHLVGKYTDTGQVKQTPNLTRGLFDLISVRSEISHIT